MINISHMLCYSCGMCIYRFLHNEWCNLNYLHGCNGGVTCKTSMLKVYDDDDDGNKTWSISMLKCIVCYCFICVWCYLRMKDLKKKPNYTPHQHQSNIQNVQTKLAKNTNKFE